MLTGCILAGENPNIDYPGNVVAAVTGAVQIVSAVGVTLVFLSIDRRPDVFTPEGRVVERQYQSSIWARYSYNWSSDILDLSAKKPIEFSDLPAMDSHIRAKDAKQSFQSIMLKPTVSLWLQIFLGFQVASSAPSMALYRLVSRRCAPSNRDAEIIGILRGSERI
jgi:hypothetical protein